MREKGQGEKAREGEKGSRREENGVRIEGCEGEGDKEKESSG